MKKKKKTLEPSTRHETPATKQNRQKKLKLIPLMVVVEFSLLLFLFFFTQIFLQTPVNLNLM